MLRLFIEKDFESKGRKRKKKKKKKIYIYSIAHKKLTPKKIYVK